MVKTINILLQLPKLQQIRYKKWKLIARLRPVSDLNITALDAPRITIVGNDLGFYKNQFRDCVTVRSLPAIRIVPAREILGFSVTRKVTAPLPESASPLDTINQFALLLTA